MPADERERQFERALQRHMRKPYDAACPDAETLAAYHERTLSSEELVHWKQHIGGCARCQETLALVEETNSIATPEWEEAASSTTTAGLKSGANVTANLRTMRGRAIEGKENAVPEMARAASPALKFVQRKSWRWLAPAGALAAGLLIFVVVRGNKLQKVAPQPTVEVAQNRETTAPMPKQEETPREAKREEPTRPMRDSSPPAQSTPRIQNKSTAPAGADQLGPKAYEYSARADELDKLKKNDGETSKALDDKAASLGDKRLAGKARSDLDNARANQLSSAPQAEATPVPAAPPAPAAGASGNVGGVSGTAGGTKQESSRDAQKSKSLEMSTEMMQAERKEKSAQGPRFALAGSALKDSAARDPRFILAPDGRHAWHVGAAGTIEATADGGKSWSPQTSKVLGDLKSGSAPSEKVCWIVGQAGTILLTTDGGMEWTKINSPLQEDLGGVHAVDAKHASIWNVTNQKSYETADRGITWMPAANE